LHEEIFLEKLKKSYGEFLRPYDLRKLVFSRVIDHIFVIARSK
jgi:hypothetical protein